MSYWTYITGVIEVCPMGRTQPEKRYILDTVLEHLPKVTGSERNMSIHIVQKAGTNGSSSCNEFGEWLKGDPFRTQDYYLIVLEGSLRDRIFEDTFIEVNKFLNRLAKRVMVNDILVKISGYDKDYHNKSFIISNAKPYKKMEEGPSWCNEEIAWAEYLMWDYGEDSWYPKKLEEKYAKGNV